MRSQSASLPSLPSEATEAEIERLKGELSREKAENEQLESQNKQLKIAKEKADGQIELLGAQLEVSEMDNHRLRSTNEALRDLVITDELTRLHSLRGFRTMAPQAIHTFVRGLGQGDHSTSSEVVVAMFDLDHFKIVNDTYGHAVGNQFLCATAEHLMKMFRSTDLLARVGGEEFAGVLLGTTIEGILTKKFARSGRPPGLPPITLKIEGHQITRTVSAGLTTYRPGEKIQDALARADKALYEAKAAGRDQILPYATE